MWYTYKLKLNSHWVFVRCLQDSRPIDLAELSRNIEQLRPYIIIKNGITTLNWNHQPALIALNSAILKFHFNLHWTLNAGNLCPSIPSRLNYLTWLYQLIQEKGVGQEIKGIDIGTGASLIFPLLGVANFGWSWIATDIDPKSLQHARTLIKANELQNSIELRESSGWKLDKSLGKADFCICNPPYYSCNSNSQKLTPSQQCTQGGQYQFFFELFSQSYQVRDDIKIFTCLIGLRENLESAIGILQDQLVGWFKVGQLRQGHQPRFVLAWQFK